MQLNVTTDYAVRIILYLGRERTCRTAKEISEEMCIPKKYLVKVLAKLRKGGVITSVSGYAGGYQLNKSLSEIRIGEILDIMERTMKINACLEQEDFCINQKRTEGCPFLRFYAAMQEELEQKWLSVSLQSILDHYRTG